MSIIGIITVLVLYYDYVLDQNIQTLCTKELSYYI